MGLWDPSQAGEIPPQPPSPEQPQAMAPIAEALPPPPPPAPAETVSLDPELIAALGAHTSDTPVYGKNIHDSLSNLWTPILKKGISKEEKDKLFKDYLIPENCKLLQAPTLNPEISAAISEMVRGRDKKHLGYQQQLGCGTAAVNRAMDIMLQSESNPTIIGALKHMSDACRILSDLHHDLTLNRTKLITPSLEKSFINIISDVNRDEFLFGSSLGEKIKASRAIERQGTQIRKPASHTAYLKTGPQAVRSSVQGNWAGPPRHPGSRGGRGGPRRYMAGPAGLPPRRANYPTYTTTTRAPPPPPRSTPQHAARGRAPHQQ